MPTSYVLRMGEILYVLSVLFMIAWAKQRAMRPALSSV